MPATRKLNLKLESKLDSVQAAELLVQRLGQQYGLGEEDCDQLGMAVRECMVNAVTHGNAYNRRKSVNLSIAVEPGRLVVRVGDEGTGFDLDEVPDPLAEDNLLKTSGRGLLLMRAFVDDLTVRRTKGRGTEVVMVKNAPQAASLKEEEDVSLAVSTREVDGVTIVDLSGRITLGEGSGTLRDTIRSILGQGQKKVLLNLGEVSYIDSSGLGELVSSYTTAANQGAQLKLVNVTKKVQDLLSITKLYTVFDTYDDEAQAVTSFS